MLSRRALLGTAALLPIAGAARAQVKQDDTTFPGFRREVLVRWGDRVDSDAPPFTPAQLTAEATATQFGWDAAIIGLAIGPEAADGVPRGILAVLHPTAEGRMMFPGGQDRPLIAIGAQGASILNLERQGTRWVIVDGGFQTRRITASTLCSITGPATSETGEAIQGVLAPQSGCVTPWGTLLMAEGDPQPWLARLQDRGQHLPVAAHANAYGWLVELDPFNPQSVPAKRTALGRFPRAGVAATKSAKGHAVVFMTDDQVAGHLYRFVSDAPADGDTSPLDSGTLSVAVNKGGWTIGFVPLPKGIATLTAIRQAASQLGATVFDSPAGMAVGEGGTLFLTCRGNAQRQQSTPFNPSVPNPDGQVLLFRPDDHDPAAAEFAGEITIICGGGPAAGPSGWMSRPSAITLGAKGEMWLATEASGLGVAAADMSSAPRVYIPPVGALMGGVAITPDGTTLLSAVRHPGATPGASFDHPATRWPSLLPNMPPQTTIVTLARTS